MKTRNGLIITVTAVVSICLASTSAWAGSVQQHRWEGVAIGVGAVILGSALINHHGHYHHAVAPVRYGHGHHKQYRHGTRHHYGYGKHNYRGPYRNGKSHYRGHGFKRQHHDRGPHAFTRGNRGYGRQGKSHDRYGSPNRGKHGGKDRHGRGNRGH